MVINQGDVFWIDMGEPEGSEPGYERPFVVIQNNVFNASRLNTVIICAITSSLKRGSAPGNVTLNDGEANLSKPSVVLVSQVYTVDKSQLGEYIGTLSRKRVSQILDGLELVTEPREIE
jgi:mRNA interferase MazF